MSKPQFEWADAHKGWKRLIDGEERIVPFSEMSTSELRKLHRFAQKKELTYMNKAAIFYDKYKEMEEEAARRGVTLKRIDVDFMK